MIRCAMMDDTPALAGALAGTQIVTLAPNLPGPLAAATLRDFGASVIRIDSPNGDLLATAAPAWHAALHRDVTRVMLDLKSPPDRARLDALLSPCDVLLTSLRPSALARLGLDWPRLHARFARLIVVSIVGEAPPNAERVGHDLTYVAQAGMLDPPALPKMLVADMAGAERAVATVLALLLRRATTGRGARAYVSLRAAADRFAAPFRYGLTSSGGVLGGAHAAYGIYRAADAWIAIAALEPNFVRTLVRELGCDYALAFAGDDAASWERWGVAHDVPIAVVRS